MYDPLYEVLVKGDGAVLCSLKFSEIIFRDEQGRMWVLHGEIDNYHEHNIIQIYLERVTCEQQVAPCSNLSKDSQGRPFCTRHQFVVPEDQACIYDQGEEQENKK